MEKDDACWDYRSERQEIKAQLVADTGVNAMDWSREKVIEYSVATDGIPIYEATAEFERYAV